MPLGAKHRAFDTPGVPHTHQLTSKLGLEDVKKVRMAGREAGGLRLQAMSRSRSCCVH